MVLWTLSLMAQPQTDLTGGLFYVLKVLLGVVLVFVGSMVFISVALDWITLWKRNKYGKQRSIRISQEAGTGRTEK
ncbi:MAG: hypothetical protein HY652_11700 [Acidobacteria bacterium]|nr:hypothetical protein [Acidobacteriota bacterium]